MVETCHTSDTLFKNVRFAKNIWQIINIIHVASIFHENIIRYLSMDITFPLKLTVFLGLCSRKTVHFSKQIMSVEISKHIFTPYNLSKIIHTEFADLVDTLRTQLKPTAAKIKWHYKVNTYHFQKFYFNNAVHKKHHIHKYITSSRDHQVSTKNSFLIGFSHWQ